MTPTGAIGPGGTIGVLGSGQLARMLAIAAKAMGYRIYTYSPQADTPAGQVCDREFCAPYEDAARLTEFAEQVDVITLEFENIPVSALEILEQNAPVHPAPRVLHIAQHRLREKRFLQDHGFPVVPFAPVSGLSDLTAALNTLGTPAVLKTAGFGYDGKGQSRLNTADDIPAAWDRIGQQEAVLEAFVDYALEISVVAARNPQGAFAHYGAIENQHRHHILDLSIVPARINEETARQAVDLTRRVMDTLEVVGVMCVEFFVDRDGQLLINELAPRPHNSGHFSIDAAVTSQFEQQLRAVCGLPLGSTRLLSPAVMGNLLGDLWEPATPVWDRMLAYPEIKLHLYGKHEPRPGRKMGHITVLNPDVEQAIQQVVQARSVLQTPPKAQQPLNG